MASQARAPFWRALLESELALVAQFGAERHAAAICSNSVYMFQRERPPLCGFGCASWRLSDLKSAFACAERRLCRGWKNAKSLIVLNIQLGLATTWPRCDD